MPEGQQQLSTVGQPLEVIIRYGTLEKKITGQPEQVAQEVLSFLNETIPEFEQRINKFSREDGYEAANLGDPGWQFGRGSGFTSVGSLHSDVWRGTAASLASRGHIAVYPTMGWWNKRQHLGAWGRTARYSLIVTIATPEVETDLYTPVANQIGVPIVVEV